MLLVASSSGKPTCPPVRPVRPVRPVTSVCPSCPSWYVRLSVLTLVAVAGGCRDAPVAEVAIDSIAPANATLSHGFTHVLALSELTDGKVILTEGGPNNRVAVADFTTDTVVELSRHGSGPGEYAFPDGLYSIGPDSALLSASDQRWLMIEKTTVTQTITLETGSNGSIYGADRLGKILVSSSPPLDPNGFPLTPADSSFLVLWDRATGRADTIGKTYIDPRSISDKITLWYPSELPTLAWDGWVAVLRKNPYRVDWRAPSGEWTLGSTIAEPIPLTAEERAAYAAFRKRVGRPPVDESRFEWPSEIPPFSGVLITIPTLDGRLLVERTFTAKYPRRYDVIDHRGRLERQVVVGERSSIVGFGAKSVYLITTDDDDVQHLSRHPWP